ncbi:hypothetical protein PR202_gb09317 [Eleusine coracana subsp. coracana]|uniref:Uncharacterized protein n=1 Tax=Eleusine coracana subsp. coracana TaxID=191504 RepID=A0AAV5EH24_ELECO|nr:hypothetical protein PR202_gb09317 [Eleusine coracana subsp. coracana]
MVVGFRRTISFPAPKSPAPSSAGNTKSAAYRARSASLPCRFHPLVLQLDDDIADLRATVARLAPSGGGAATAGSVSAAAEQLARVLVSLSDLLHHPQAQDPLRRLGRSPLAERLLDDFLRLADAHGSFRAAMVSLAALQAEARAALRREDPARLASAARALRRSGRDLPRIARAVAAKAPPATPPGLPADAAAIAAAVGRRGGRPGIGLRRGLLRGVGALRRRLVGARRGRVLHAVLDALPRAVRRRRARRHDAEDRAPRHHHQRRSARRRHADDDSSSSSTRPHSHATAAAVVDPDEKEREVAFERLDNLERCIVDVESSGEKVFRALVNTRVSLLNILSPAF